jgi:hypothetical protein
MCVPRQGRAVARCNLSFKSAALPSMESAFLRCEPSKTSKDGTLNQRRPRAPRTGPPAREKKTRTVRAEIPSQRQGAGDANASACLLSIPVNRTGQAPEEVIYAKRRSGELVRPISKPAVPLTGPI